MSKILNNIWQQLSNDGQTQNDFETWESNFNESEDVQNNVYNYLEKNKLTKSTQTDWNNNIKKDKKQFKIENVLTEKYGTSDRDEILAQTLGNNLYADVSVFDGSMATGGGSSDRITSEVWDNLPIFDDGDVNEYLYKDLLQESYSPDFLPAVGSWLGLLDEDDIITERSRYEGEDAKENLKNDLVNILKGGGALKVLARKNAIIPKEIYTTKHSDPNKRTELISDYFSQSLSVDDKEIRSLYEQGKWDEAVEKSEKQGYVLLYNKDGKSVQWDQLTTEEQQSADPKDIKVVDNNIEQSANAMAETMNLSDKEVAVNRREELTYQLMGILKIMQSNYNDYEGLSGEEILSKMDEASIPGANINPATKDLFSQLYSNFKNEEETINSILQSGEANELIGRLKPLTEGFSGNQPIIKEYNRLLEEVSIINRAIEINTDLSVLPEEIMPGVTWTGDDVGLSNDEYETRFEDLWTQMGYEKNELGEKQMRASLDINPIKFGGEYGIKLDNRFGNMTFDRTGGINMFGKKLYNRDIVEGVNDFGEMIVPLIASIYITKKIPVGTISRISNLTGRTYTLTRTVGSELTRRGNQIVKVLTKTGPAWTQSPVRNFVTKLVVGGFTETAVLSAADQINQRIFQQDGMVFDNKTGAFTPEFAFGLGVGNAFAGTVMKGLYKSKKGVRMLNYIKKSKDVKGMRTVDRRFGNVAEKMLVQAPAAALGGVFSMEIAKVFSGQRDESIFMGPTDYSKFKEEGFETEQGYRDHIDEKKFDLAKHIISDGMAMYLMGMMGPGGLKKAWETDVENYSIEKKRISKASKNLSKESGVEIKEGENLNKINEAERKAKKITNC